MNVNLEIIKKTLEGAHSASDIEKVLAQAEPYIEKMSGKKMVVKASGKTISAPELVESFAKDIACLKMLGIEPVVVHGGGQQINQALANSKLQPVFKGGLRVTDKSTMDIVLDVLLNKVSRQLQAAINKQAEALAAATESHSATESYSGRAFSKQMASGGKILIQASQLNPDLGFVGRVESVNTRQLLEDMKDGFVPVVSSVGISEENEQVHFNINADTAASEVAIALSAERLHILSDVDGIYESAQKMQQGQHLSEINFTRAQKLLAAGSIQGGMIPKLNACLDALSSGVGISHILNGSKPNDLIFELFTDSGTGTMIVAEPKNE